MYFNMLDFVQAFFLTFQQFNGSLRYKSEDGNTVKKRVRIPEWQRESRRVGRDAGGYAEDGFGVALVNCLKWAARQ